MTLLTSALFTKKHIQADILETTPAENVAAELGLGWQSTRYQVCFIDLARQILARRESASIAQTVLDKLGELAARFDSAEPEPLVGQWPNTYALRIGEQRAIFAVNRQERLITVYLIGRDRELRRRTG